MHEDVRDTISRLFEGHADSLYRFASLSLPGHIDARDVVQEVFLKAYRSWGTFRQGASTRTWLYKIAKNHIYDVLRKHQREKRNEAYILAQSPMTTGLGSLLEYEEILYKLHPKYRDVLILKVMDGFSLAEIAAILGCKSATVRIRYLRAREKMKELLCERQTTPEGVNWHGR